MSAPLVTILDDEPAIRAMLSDVLDEAGFRSMALARVTECAFRAHPVSD